MYMYEYIWAALIIAGIKKNLSDFQPLLHSEEYMCSLDWSVTCLLFSLTNSGKNTLLRDLCISQDIYCSKKPSQPNKKKNKTNQSKPNKKRKKNKSIVSSSGLFTRQDRVWLNKFEFQWLSFWDSSVWVCFRFCFCFSHGCFHFFFKERACLHPFLTLC